MSAGLSQKQITSRIYNRLKSLEYELSKAGVNTVYNKGTASKRGHLVFFDGEGIAPAWNGDGGFNISYDSDNLSNGETFITGRIYLVWKGARRAYGWIGNDDGTFEQGLDFIKANFAVVPQGTEGQDRKSYSDTQDRDSYTA
jgi:hypothetical protein